MVRRLSICLVVLGCLGLAGSAWASDTDTKTLTINATVKARAKLTLSPDTINFADADPDDLPSIAADYPVTVTAKVRTGSSSKPDLVVQANGDLKNANGDIIEIGNVSWNATGSGFKDGTMDKSTAQDVASWTGSGNRSGTLRFFLANSWDYATGSYTATATYTLTAP